MADNPRFYLAMESLPPVVEPSGTATAGSQVSVSNAGLTNNCYSFTGGELGAGTGSSVYNYVIVGFTFPTPTAFSGEMWIESTDKKASTRLMYYYRGSNLPHINLSLNDSGQPSITFGDYGKHKTASSTLNVQDGQWHHLAFTHDNGTLRLYVDGVLRATATGVVATAGDAGSLFLGGSGSAANSSADSVNGRSFGGLMDNVATYSSVLTPERIAAHYNEAFVVPAPPIDLTSGTAGSVSLTGLGATATFGPRGPLTLSTGLPDVMRLSGLTVTPRFGAAASTQLLSGVMGSLTISGLPTSLVLGETPQVLGQWVLEAVMASKAVTADLHTAAMEAPMHTKRLRTRLVARATEPISFKEQS